MKIRLTGATFDASAKTVLHANFSDVGLGGIMLIINVTDNVIIYNFADPTLGGSLSTDTLTLDFDTTTMDDADVLMILVDDGVATDTVSGTVAVTGVATAAKQDTIIGHLDGVEGLLTTIAGDTTDIEAAIEIIDDAIVADDAAFTPATTKLMMSGFFVDDTSTDSVDEGDAGAARMSSDRILYVQGAVASGATDAGNPIKVGGRYNSTLPTLTNGQRGDFQVGTRGAQGVQIMDTNGTSGAAVETTGGDAGGDVAALDVNGFNRLYSGSSWGRARTVINATDSTGLGIAACGFLAQFDDTSPGTVTENRFGNIRMSVRREMYAQLRDAAGNERGLNIDANGEVGIGAIRTSVTPGVAAANLGKAEDAAHASGDTGIASWGVRNDNLATTYGADQDYAPRAVDLAGRTMVAQKAATATLSNVGGSASSVTLLSANSARIGATITNDSSALLYIKFGATASTTSYVVVLSGAAAAPFAYYEVPAGYTGRIDGIWASATGNARVNEMT